VDGYKKYPAFCWILHFYFRFLSVKIQMNLFSSENPQFQIRVFLKFLINEYNEFKEYFKDASCGGWIIEG